jgi:hypothetical protein
VGTFHHQNPFILRTLIDNDRNKPPIHRKRSSSNVLTAASGHVSRLQTNDDKLNNYNKNTKTTKSILTFLIKLINLKILILN